MQTLTWIVGRSVYNCDVHAEPCMMCGAFAVVAMPAPIIKQQPDDTTAVCHPGIGDCNQGYAANVGEARLEREL